MTEAVQVQTTTANREDAEQIAATLVDRRLAACVQISGPLESHYRWQGKRETATEWLCTIKTSRRLYPQLEQELRSLHPYDEPEILAVPVVAGSAGYLTWLEQQLEA